MTPTMQVLQLTLAIAIGTTALLYAVTSPAYRPIATSHRSRLVIAFCVTLMVASMPILMPSVGEFITMLVVGTMGMYGMITLTVGPASHKRTSRNEVTVYKPRGYRWLDMLVPRAQGVR